MHKQTVYKGRPCYIRHAVYIEYLDAQKPVSEFVVLVDSDEPSKTLWMDVNEIELT